MNLFELFVKVGVDDQASGKLGELSGKLGNGLKTAAKIGTAAVGAAAAGIGALTKAAVDNYAEYEQLVGGVDTLFKDASQKVQQYAANAYKTAGMSANEYMSTVTSFSASLLQSLGGDTEAAAQKADQAITDMADNANKMGTSMEMIQNAYQGFAKQNYTMLDNLKLGYGGTKEEMQRLLEDAEKLSGIEYDISNYADIVDAIHVVQTEIGITGTTVAEASSTISGSLSSLKASWINLLTGFGDENANVPELVQKVIDSAVTTAGNIIPRIGEILNGITEAIVSYAPVVIEKGKEFISWLGNGILEGVPVLIEKLPEVIASTINFLAENLPTWSEKGMEFVGKLAFGIIQAIPDLVAKLPEVITAAMNFFTNQFPTVLKKGGEILGQLIMGILGAIPDLVMALPQVLTAIVDAVKSGWEMLRDAGKYLLEGLWEGIKSKITWLKDKVTGVISNVVGGVKDFLGIASPSKVFAGIGGYMAEGLGKGWEDEYGAVKRKIENGLDFGTANIDFSASGVGQMQRGFSTAMQTASAMAGEIKIVVQSVLDGDVIGETAYTYAANKARAYGG